MGKAPSASAPPLACPKNHHKKLDKKREKIDKNGTFIVDGDMTNILDPESKRDMYKLEFELMF